MNYETVFKKADPQSIYLCNIAGIRIIYLFHHTQIFLNFLLRGNTKKLFLA